MFLSATREGGFYSRCKASHLINCTYCPRSFSRLLALHLARPIYVPPPPLLATFQPKLANLPLCPSRLPPRLTQLIRALFRAFSDYPPPSRSEVLRTRFSVSCAGANIPVKVNGVTDRPSPADSDFLTMDRGLDQYGTKRTTMSLLMFLGVCESAGLVIPAVRVASTLGGNDRGGGLVEGVVGSQREGGIPRRGRGDGGCFGFVGGAAASTLNAGAEVTTVAPDKSCLSSFVLPLCWLNEQFL